MALSIIIPVLNEEKLLPILLNHLLLHKNSDDEIILVDGGSIDNSREICTDYNVRLIESMKACRAHQMNAGANLAKNDIFYFLHADALPPENFSTEIRQAIREGHALGGYKLQLGERTNSLKSINSFFTKLNCLIFQGGGDMSTFVSKKVFLELNGFNEQYVIMEDFDFIRRARKKKIKKKILDNHIKVSDRKYQTNSYLKVQLANLIAYAAFTIGIRPITIKSFYNSVISKS